jgi:hypothetical protein
MDLSWQSLQLCMDFTDLRMVLIIYLQKCNCNVCIDFLNSQICKEIMLELNGMVSLQVLLRPQLIFSLPKPGFFGIYLNFQWQKSLKNRSLPHSESKSYQINFIKSCSSRSFQQHQRHIPIPPKFSALISIYFTFQWRNHSIFKNFCTASPKHHGTKPMHPSSSRAFQRDQEQSEASWFGGSHKYKTKQNNKQTNKLPCFIDRCLFFFTQ